MDIEDPDQRLFLQKWGKTLQLVLGGLVILCVLAIVTFVLCIAVFEVDKKKPGHVIVDSLRPSDPLDVYYDPLNVEHISSPLNHDTPDESVAPPVKLEVCNVAGKVKTTVSKELATFEGTFMRNTYSHAWMWRS